MQIFSFVRRLSISTRLALWYGASMLVLLSVFVIYLYTSFHVSLHQDLNRQLQETKRSLLQTVSINAGKPDLQGDRSLQTASYSTGNTFIRLLSPDGEVIGRSSSFTGRPTFTPQIPRGTSEDTYVHQWDGNSARSLYAPITTAGANLQGWIEVTRLESGIHRELHRLVWLLGIGVVLGTTLSVGGGYLLARRTLRPMTRLTEAAQDIQANDLGRRLPPGVGDELSDLAGAFNQMLDRLERSFKREQQFRADAAHELMTPLSAAQSEIEVTLWRERSPDEYRERFQAVLRNIQRMSAIVEDLLDLSHAEALTPAGSPQTDISELVSQHLRQIESQTERSDITIETSIEPRMTVRTAASDLETICSNLLDNAVKYTSYGGAISVSVESRGDTAVLCVKDTGIGFTAEEEERLFDRFYRSDHPNVQHQPGTGLGLSVTRAIVAAYGGRLSAESAGRGRGSRFTVRLPLARKESGRTTE